MPPLFHARCIAPPLTDEILTECPALADECEPALREAMKDLLLIVQQAKLGMQVQVPDQSVRNGYAAMFGSLPQGKRGTGIMEDHQTPDGRTYQKEKYEITNARANQINTAAWHLLWYVNELACGRHPG